jgi:acetolactate synthase I/II/III large subunit
VSMNAAQALIEMLKAYGVDYVFGVPGDTSIPFYDALHAARDSITHVMTRDERGASYMADVYARLTGRPGVCEAPSGAGALYLVPGLAEAHASSIPVIAFTSDTPLDAEGRNVLTELDQGRLFEAVTKWRTTLKRAELAPEVMRKAFRLATTGRPGPVQITLPEDVLEERVGERASFHAEAACRTFPAYRTAAEPAAIAEAARLLVSAKRPVVVAGGGAAISGAWLELTALAEALSMPVGTSINGQGSMAEAHPLSLGVVGGNGARPYANEVVALADLVLFVGCKTDSVTTLNWTLPANHGKVTVIQLDADPAEIGNTYSVSVGLAGDARSTLHSLLEAVRGLLAGEAAAGREPWADFAGLRAAWFSGEAAKMASEASPLKPQRVMRALQGCLPADSVIVADAGTGTPFTSAYYLSPAGRHVIIPRGYGGLGYAIPGVVGAKLARPNSTVIGLVGDGSFGMSCGELETIARLNLRVVLLLFNNAMFGWIKNLQHLYRDQRYLSVDFSADTDYAGIAHGFGLRGVRIREASELEPALQAALAADGPTLIDVRTESELEEVPPVERWLQTAAQHP